MISLLAVGAWILWLSPLGGQPEPREGFDTKYECELAIVDTLNAKVSAGFHTTPGGWIYQGKDGLWRVMLISCLPDSIDPRRPR
jgi:hypothetical protein